MSHALWPRDLIVMSRWHQEKAEIDGCSHRHVLEAQRWFGFYLEAVFELLGDEEEDYGIDAGVDGCHVDAEVVEHQQEAATTEEERIASVEEDWEVTLFGLFFCVSVFVRLLQQLTAVSVVGSVDGSLQQATQMKREPAQSEDQNQAEHGFGHFSALWRENLRQNLILCVVIRSSAAPRRVCASTCLTCSLRVIRRLPFRCRSISQVIRP